jgi:hypothetical protein
VTDISELASTTRRPSMRWIMTDAEEQEEIVGWA